MVNGATPRIRARRYENIPKNDRFPCRKFYVIVKLEMLRSGVRVFFCVGEVFIKWNLSIFTVESWGRY